MLKPARALFRTPRTVAALALKIALAVPACALVSTSAQAIPYFNASFGFDNSTLMLDEQFVIPLNATFPFIAAGTTTTDIGLLSEDVINDTVASIDRTITWTIINNDPATISEILIFLTALAPTPTDYSGANIDLGIDSHDAMVIDSFGPYFLAGFYLTLDDFALVNGDLIATRQFSYTVDVPEGAGGPPALGVAYTPMFTSVPEPATGLLFAGALLVVVGTGRKLRG